MMGQSSANRYPVFQAKLVGINFIFKNEAIRQFYG